MALTIVRPFPEEDEKFNDEYLFESDTESEDATEFMEREWKIGKIGRAQKTQVVKPRKGRWIDFVVWTEKPGPRPAGKDDQASNLALSRNTIFMIGKKSWSFTQSLPEFQADKC
jgi:hypothetical protein